MRDEVIRKYIKDLDELLEEISTVKLQPAWMFKENAVILLFGRIFRFLNFDDITIGHEKAGDLDAWAWNHELKRETIIEFEASSKNFDKQKHDSTKCNLIVCWEDNWKECPIDVLELKYFWEKALEKHKLNIV